MLRNSPNPMQSNIPSGMLNESNMDNISSMAQSIPKEQGLLQGLMGSPEGLQAAGSIGSNTLQAANKIIGTLLMVREMEKQRGQERRRMSMEQDLSKKAMILDYLLGNRNYREKLDAIRMKTNKAGRDISSMNSSSSEKASAQAYRG